jgi:hypothetical protein
VELASRVVGRILVDERKMEKMKMKMEMRYQTEAPRQQGNKALLTTDRI